MNEISILVSIKFTPRERSLQRLPSTKKNGVFGVKIEVVAKYVRKMRVCTVNVTAMARLFRELPKYSLRKCVNRAETWGGVLGRLGGAF